MKFLPFRFPGVPDVRCAFTGRAFGNVSLDLASCSTERALLEETVRLRETIPSALGVRAFAEVHQVHGLRTVFEPDGQEPDKAANVDADGLATSRAGLALMVKTADCQPILVAHSSGRFVMAIHAGWRGNRHDYPRLAVLEFCEHYGLEPTELWAVRGPSLGPAAAEFVRFGSEWGRDFIDWYDEERRTMDLWRLTRHQLISAGMADSRILGLDVCTYENAEILFSYRQFRRNGRADGRQASFIWIG